MKTLIVCASYHHGNTQKVAERIGAVLNATLIKAGTGFNADEYDLIGFGSGIYFRRHHHTLTEVVAKLNLKNKGVFVFSTSGLGLALSNRRLIKLLKEKGARVIGSFACRGFDTVGPLKLIGGIARNHPNDKDLKKAEAFALGLIDKNL